MKPRILPHNYVTTITMLFLMLTCAEGCLPSWFRQERNEPQALEGAHQVLTNEISDSYELFDPAKDENFKEVHHSRNEDHPPKHHHGHGKHEGHQGNNADEEEEDLDEFYGTPAPIKYDEKLELAKRIHEERECPGWCFRGGTCHVTVDEETYEYISKSCSCPPSHWGARCDYSYVQVLYAPVKGQEVRSDRSSIQALSTFLIVILMALALTLYTYRRLSRRNFEDWKSRLSSSMFSQQSQLRSLRSDGLYGTPTASFSTSIRLPFTPSERRTPRIPTDTSASHPILLPTGHISIQMTDLSSQIVTNDIAHDSRSHTPGTDLNPRPLMHEQTSPCIAPSYLKGNAPLAEPEIV